MPPEWEAIRQAAADYMFDELVLRPMADTMWIYDVIQEELNRCVCGVTMYFDMEEIKRRQGGQVVVAMMAFL
jgi:acetone carboxylase gamma subunit